MGVTTASFHSSGKTPKLMDWLKIIVRKCAITSAASVTSLAEIRSDHGDLFFLIFNNIEYTLS